MLKQEALLPGTSALPRGTVEVSHYGRSILVRHRDRAGTTTQRRFGSRDDAMAHFWIAAERLQAEAQGCQDLTN